MKYLLSEVAGICGGEFSGRDSAVNGVVTDSRSFSVGAGTLFVAICGSNHDGHDYIGELYARGVAAFVVEKDVDTELYPQAGFVRVANAVEALQDLAADWRRRFRGKVAAVTGSNGKTVVKEWAAQLAPSGVRIFRSPGSYNSQVGVPLSLLMMNGDEDLAIIEAGISQPGEMARLARMIAPDIGVFTTIGDAHQENFASQREKIEEKARLFDTCTTIIYNGAYEGVKEYVDSVFGDKRLVDSTDSFPLCEGLDEQSARENCALVLALYGALGYDPGKIARRIPELQPVAMRLELKEGLNDSVVINDSYNADINSLAIAVNYLKNISAGRRTMLVLSDILQSGMSDEELYAKVADIVREAGVDRIVGIGPKIGCHAGMFTCEKAFYPTVGSCLDSLRTEDMAGRAILVKGNRSSQFERISHAMERKSHTTVLEVNLDALIHNLNVHRAMLRPETKLVAMVKASSYGHGTFEIASTLQQQGVDYLAVAFADEGVALREKGIGMPVVVLNADADSFGPMVSWRLEPEIYSFTSLRDFVAAVKRHGERHYPIHIKIDSGMHRLGFQSADMDRLCEVLAAESDIVTVRSMFSHLAVSDEPTQDDFTRRQIALFDEMCDRISGSLGYAPLRHIDNSAGIERFPEAQHDMCRLGLGLYGFSDACGDKLRPVSTLKTRIVQIKDIPLGETVGYGRKGVPTRPTRIATIPVGYADGLNRRLSCGAWSVRIAGKPAPVFGRICMDSCMVDITDIPGVCEGDEVVIFSPDEGYRVSDMAEVLGTIPYEIMTSVSSRVKRIYIKE